MALLGCFFTMSSSSVWAQEEEALSDLERAADEADIAKGITRYDRESEEDFAREFAKTQKNIDELVAREEAKRAAAKAAGTTLTEMENREVPGRNAGQNTSTSKSANNKNASTAATPEAAPVPQEETAEKEKPASNMIYIKPTPNTSRKLWNEVR